MRATLGNWNAAQRPARSKGSQGVRTRKCAAALLCLGAAVSAAPAQELPPGFSLSVVTDELPSARQMALSDEGVLLVGSLRAGNLYAVVLGDDWDAEPEVVVFARRLAMPSGLVLLGDDLYVAALDRVLRYPAIASTFRNSPTPQIVTDALPNKRHHGWKCLSVGPDGHLYVPVGAPCNICLSEDEHFASILRMHPRSGETTVYAHGVRNSVGMAWHPQTGVLWFTDNGHEIRGRAQPRIRWK